MFTAADALNALHLEASCITGALHVTDARATLELFASSGRLFLYVATAGSLEPPGVRSVWTVHSEGGEPVLVAVGTLAPQTPMPVVGFWHRRRQVRGRMYRLGPFWLAEAVGARLRLTVDDGVHTTVAKIRRIDGPVRLHRRPSQLAPVAALPFLRTN